MIICLTKCIGEANKDYHDDSKDKQCYLQVLFKEFAELDGSQASLFEAGRIALVMVVMVMLFRHSE